MVESHSNTRIVTILHLLCNSVSCTRVRIRCEAGPKIAFYSSRALTFGNLKTVPCAFELVKQISCAQNAFAVPGIWHHIDVENPVVPTCTACCNI